ncbi:MAG: hypothetical protein A4E53_01788 [Pelotomaculum sp. PtaB.Bin104]|nr:MAG: hypothetical protein A4E53_01788 [Pelotomaculum sp. PtaB.Bin104]
MVAWWSLVYPGFGHFRLVATLKGAFLFIGELLINTYCHLNLAIIYTFTGNFAMAKQVLNIHLLLLYCGILVFAIWDSYRITLEINKVSVLADHADAPITPTALGPAALNALDKRNPWVAVAWSALGPGLGHIYCASFVHAFFLMVTGVIIIFFFTALPGHLLYLHRSIYPGQSSSRLAVAAQPAFLLLLQYL